MSRYQCREQGCERGPATGHGLYRTSPKGESFEGACDEHFDGPADPIVQVIENDSQRRRVDRDGPT